MKHRTALSVLVAGVASLAVGPTQKAVAATAPAPVANIYVQTTPGVMVYNAAANGTLTLVKGSPFKVSGQMEDISGKYLISVGDTYLHVYSIASNGAVGGQVSQINTASYGGSECGGTSNQGSVLDHNGQYLYVQLNTLNKCAAWQTYRLESNGYLQFLGDVSPTSSSFRSMKTRAIRSLPARFRPSVAATNSNTAFSTWDNKLVILASTATISVPISLPLNHHPRVHWRKTPASLRRTLSRKADTVSFPGPGTRRGRITTGISQS